MRFIPTSSGLPLVDKLFELVRQALDSFQPLVVTNDHVTANIVVTAPLVNVDVRVFHGLGQPMAAFDVVRLSAAAIVYEGTASLDPKTYINLRASAACTYSVRFT
jgi:hypothetical protein